MEQRRLIELTTQSGEWAAGLSVVALMLLSVTIAEALARGLHWVHVSTSTFAASAAVIGPVALVLGGWALGQRRAAGLRHHLRTAHDARVAAVREAARTLEIVFQPIVDLDSARCVGHEALARFADGAGPEEWFAEAHHLGAAMGVDLELAAVQRALDTYTGGGMLSVNASPAALMSERFAELVSRRRAGTRLVVELTEHAAVRDYEELRDALAGLRAHGVQVAVDDAGSGVSSMRHVLALAPDIIKLDCSLITDIDQDSARRAMAASLERFADELGVSVVAEGIERPEEWQVCAGLGIALGQGYLFGRPGSDVVDHAAVSVPAAGR